MIYTCTFNPSIDYIQEIKQLVLNEVNRSSTELLRPGGKGINVSLVLQNLETPSTLLGFLGGFTGDYIENELLKNPLLTLNFTRIKGQNRINVKLKGESETEVNASGPLVTQEEINLLLLKIKKLTKEDLVILSGSGPKNASHLYEEMAHLLNDHHIPFVVDTTKNALRSTLKYHPLLIKPNRSELEELFETSITVDEQVIHYARKLIEEGAQRVLVSLGEEGSILVTTTTTYKASVPHGQLVNSVGSGDSMVAGFIHSFLENNDEEEALRLAAACGTATAYQQGFCTKEDILKVRDKIKLTRLEV